MTQLVIVSPHLDDAVFSCGTLISAARIGARVLVVTVCAGIPVDDVPASGLDAAAGHASGAEAAASRRREDVNACQLLGCDFVHLDVLDAAYDPRPHDERVEAIRVALGAVRRLDGVLVGPWGIRHPDHVAVAEALRGDVNFVYEELPYRVLWSEFLPHDMPPPLVELPSTAVKQAAIRCYGSQVGDGPVGEALHAAERYHAASAVRVRP